MRNIKVLWGVIGLLIIGVLALAYYIMLPPSDTAEPPNPQNQNSDADPNRIVATIGERSITQQELDRKLEEKYGSELLNALLDQEAVQLEAGELHLSVNDTEIDAELERMQRGYESEEQYYESMKEQLGLTKAQLRNDVYHKLLLDKVATYNIEISDRQVTDYINKHPEEFTTPAQVHIQQMIVNDQEEARQVIQELNKGADFEALARERSIDRNSAETGGDLGWIGVDDPFVHPSILEAASGLEVNAISGPIQLDDGYAVVKLLGRTEETRLEGRKIREIVRKELALNAAPPVKEVVANLRKKWNAVIRDERLK